MLLMTRTAMPGMKAPRAKEEQFVLIEKTADEQNWEMVFEILSKKMGEATANSWIKPLRFQSFAEGDLNLQAPTKFIADWVDSHYGSQILSVWKSLGYSNPSLKIEVGLKSGSGTV